MDAIVLEKTKHLSKRHHRFIQTAFLSHLLHFCVYRVRTFLRFPSVGFMTFRSRIYGYNKASHHNSAIHWRNLCSRARTRPFVPMVWCQMLNKKGIVKYRPVVYRFIYCRVRDRQLADDLTNQTFENALKNLRQYKAGAGRNPCRWLKGIAAHQISDHYRHNGHSLDQSLDNPDAPLEVADPSPQPEEQLLNHQKLTALKRAIEALTKHDQFILHLRFEEGMSSSEIGELLGITHSAARQRLHRIILDLRDSLGKEG